MYLYTGAVVSLYRADKVLPVVRYTFVGRPHGDMHHTYNKVCHSLRRTNGSIVGTFVDFSGEYLLECNVDVLLNRLRLSWYTIGRQNFGTKA